MTDENKTEKPTPEKLREARKQGQVAKSQEITTIVGMFAFVGLAFVFYQRVGHDLSNIFADLILKSGTFVASPTTLLSLFIDTVFDLAVLILPILLLVALINVLSNYAQSGAVLSGEPLKPKFDKLNPANGLKKIFSKRTLFELAKNLVKLLMFCTLVYLSKDWLLAQAIEQLQLRPDRIPFVWANTILLLILYFACLYVPVALIDLAFTRYEFTNKMMMSMKEVKDEVKKREGDPEIKQKQKQSQKELLEKTAALSSVRGADVVITNPTHIAVALQYKPNEMVSPKVVAMGKGGLAKKIRLLAHRHQVRVIQNKPLARQLYKETQINSFVPASCYVALVPIFREILDFDKIQGASSRV